MYIMSFQCLCALPYTPAAAVPIPRSKTVRWRLRWRTQDHGVEFCDWTPCQHFVWSTTFKSVTRTVQVGKLSFYFFWLVLFCFLTETSASATWYKSERVTRSNAPDVGYCNLVLFSSKADSGIGPEKQMFYQAVACTHLLCGTWLLRWSPIP